MDSQQRRDNGGSLFTSRTPHFFKIILNDTIQRGKLMIPIKFVGKYGPDLQNAVVLQVPGGRQWKIGLSKRDGKVWLQRLREFIDYYSIDCYYFLTFRYEGNTTLSVTIFDMSGTEIKYPCTLLSETEIESENPSETEIEIESPSEAEIEIVSANLNDANLNEIEIESESSESESVDFFCRNTARPKKRDKSPVLCFDSESEDNESVEIFGEYVTSSKRRDKSPVLCFDSESEDNESVEIFGEYVTSSKRRDKSSEFDCSRSYKLRRTNSIVKTELSQKNAECSRKNLKEEFNYTTDKNGEGTGTDFRSRESETVQQLTENQKQTDCFLRANKFTSKSNKPFFMVAMRPSYVLPDRRVILYVPLSFAREHFVDNKGVAFLLYSDKTWAVKYRCETSGSSLFGGWRAFVKDNNLKVDDICVFELVMGHGNGISLKVSIFRLDEVGSAKMAGFSKRE